MKLEVTGISCGACSMIINMAVEEWEGTELLEEDGKHFLSIPKQWEGSVDSIIEAVANSNPSHNYQVLID